MSPRLIDFQVGRRSVLKSAAALTAAVALPMPFINRIASAAEGKVRIMGVETAALEDWTPFTKDTGLEVEFVGIHADVGVYRRELVANSIGDEFDIFIANGGLEDEFGPDYFHALDESKIPNWSETNEGIRSSSLIRSPDDTLYAVPAITNADSFGYYTDEDLGGEPLSWALVFDSEKTKGRVALEDNWATTLPMAATYLTVSKGVPIVDPANMTPAELKTVVDFLIERKAAGQFRALWTSFDESIDLLARKEVIISNVWEPAVKALQKDNKPVRYADTVEGYFKWMISAYVPKQAEERGTLDVAYKALGGFLGGAYAAEIAKARGYSTGRPSAGLDYATASGFSAADVDLIKDNIAKTDRKFTSKYAWANAAPTNLTAIETEWDRFRQA